MRGEKNGLKANEGKGGEPVAAVAASRWELEDEDNWCVAVRGLENEGVVLGLGLASILSPTEGSRSVLDKEEGKGACRSEGEGDSNGRAE